MSYLGIDLGTSGLRALLVDQDGHPIGSAERPYQVQNPHPGWSEQNPLDWVDALEEAVAELRAKWPAFSALKRLSSPPSPETHRIAAPAPFGVSRKVRARTRPSASASPTSRMIRSKDSLSLFARA